MEMISKSELRRRIRADLVGSSRVDIASITEGLARLIRVQGEHCVALTYDAVPRWHEVDVSSLPGLLPDVNFDVISPEKDARFPVKKYDVIIVPLFGFNVAGYRLGHGGGWYDKFLVTQPQALKIGVGYEHSLVDFTPEPHDIRMDVVITEECERDFRVQ